MDNTGHRLHVEIKAAEVLKATLQDIAGDDADLIRDTLEGETSLRELIAKSCEQVVADGGLVNGIAEAIEGLKARKDRIEKRIAFTRTACLTAMQIAELMAERDRRALSPITREFYAITEVPDMENAMRRAVGDDEFSRLTKPKAPLRTCRGSKPTPSSSIAKSKPKGVCCAPTRK